MMRIELIEKKTCHGIQKYVMFDGALWEVEDLLLAEIRLFAAQLLGLMDLLTASMGQAVNRKCASFAERL